MNNKQINIINGLTFDKAESLGFSWQEDSKKSEFLSPIEKERYENIVQEWELVIGEPANGDKNFIGLYKKLLPDLQIDLSLTPENAESHGYEWVGEVQYDREAPSIAMQGIIDDVQNNGYKLGESASSNTDQQGLYAPISK